MKEPLTKKKLNDIIYVISRYTEIVLSIILLIVIILLIFPVLYNFIKIPILEITLNQFNDFLGNALSLLIGVEFVKMLARHTAENLLEVLMFAIARQMVVEHLNMFETLIGVIALGTIFAIRKYLLMKTADSSGKLYDKL
ncbi:MAG: transporter [Blautia sp.]|nr:transporter [Blautia sp.]